jgi:hypothetical protein
MSEFELKSVRIEMDEIDFTDEFYSILANSGKPFSKRAFRIRGVATINQHEIEFRQEFVADEIREIDWSENIKKGLDVLFDHAKKEKEASLSLAKQTSATP